MKAERPYPGCRGSRHPTARDHFSNAVRGVTAARYAKGANVVVIDPRSLTCSPTERP